MRQKINTYTSPDKGNFQTEVVGKTNSNFDELFSKYKNYGAGIQKFLMKLRSPDPRYKNINISIFGDSILGVWNGTAYEITAYLSGLYPDKTFEKRQIKLGGTGSPYFMAGLWQICHYNPDLIIIMEYEGWTENDYLETMFRYIRKYTSADIAVIPWSLHAVEMDKLSAGNIDGFIEGQDQIIRQNFFTLCSKYGAQIIDVHQPWFRVLLDGSETSATLLADTLHPNSHGISYWVEEFDKHFSPLWDEEHLQYNGTEKYFNTTFFREAKELPDMTDVTVFGTWDVNVIENETEGVVACLRSSNSGSYVEFEIDGIGFELHSYGAATGQIGVLIDGATPSTFMKNIPDQIYASNELEKMYKCIVSDNLLADTETARLFYLKVQTVTRVDGVVTACTYKLIDVTKGSIVIQENLNALADETISYDGGVITIPANYAGVQNLRSESATPFAVDAIWQLYIRKYWFDAINQTNTGLRSITRFNGLERGKHTIKLLCNSGTINLESIMELK